MNDPFDHAIFGNSRHDTFQLFMSSDIARNQLENYTAYFAVLVNSTYDTHDGVLSGILSSVE